MEYQLTKGERKIIDYFTRTDNEPEYVNIIAKAIKYDASGVSTHCINLVKKGFLRMTTENCRDSRGIQTTCYYLNMDMDYDRFGAIAKYYTDKEPPEDERIARIITFPSAEHIFAPPLLTPNRAKEKILLDFFVSKFAQHYINDPKIMAYIQNRLGTNFTKNELLELFKIIRISPSAFSFALFSEEGEPLPRLTDEDMFKGIIGEKPHGSYEYRAILQVLLLNLIEDLRDMRYFLKWHTKGINLDVKMRIDTEEEGSFTIHSTDYYFIEPPIYNNASPDDRAHDSVNISLDFKVDKQPVCFICGIIVHDKCYLCEKNVCEIDSFVEDNKDIICKPCKNSLTKHSFI